jgi:hypothetical protein
MTRAGPVHVHAIRPDPRFGAIEPRDEKCHIMPASGKPAERFV